MPLPYAPPRPLRPLLALLGVMVFLAGAAAPLAGQEQDGTVLGQVISAETGEGLAALNIQVMAAADSTQRGGVLTAFDGRFRITGLAPGDYLLRITGIGYGSRLTEVFEVARGVVYDFGTVPLSVEAVSLEAITVASERSAVSYEADRTAYVVDGLPGAQGGTVSDALRSVPELDVDIEGNIEVRGERPAIWVDGRPAPVSGASLAQFLEQFPADLIDRVEVIDSPGADFDAEGPGGIVNIVLKDGVDLGASGSLFGNTGTRGSTGLGGRATLQRGDWVLSGNASLRRNDSRVESLVWRQNLASETPDIVERVSVNGNQSMGGNLGLRTTWSPRDEARWNLRFDMGAQGGERDGIVTTTYLDGVEVPTFRFDRSDLADSGSRSFNLRSDFEWRWEPRRHELDMEVRYGRGSDERDSVEEILEDDLFAGDELEADDLAFVPAEIALESEDGSERELRLDVNYRRPLGESATLRSGASFRSDSNDNVRTLTLLDDLAGDGGGSGEASLRGYGRNQRVASAFVTLQRELMERVSLQVGMRVEQLSWELDLPGTGELDRDYLDFFPSVNLNWRMDSSRRVRVSYSRRVGRPGVSVLDPTNRSTDPLQRNVGNPDIDPRTTHRVNLNASWTTGLGTLSVGPYLNRTVNGWERITSVDPQGVTVRTWDNLSSQTTTGGSLNFSFRGVGSWRGSANASASRSRRDADMLDPRFRGTSSSWNTRLNLNGTLVGDLTMQTSMRYRAASRSLQGRDGAQVSADVSFRYRFLDRRASASLSLRDPFALQRSESEIRDATIWEIRESTRDPRSAQLSVSYSFGGGGSARRGRR